MIVFINGQFVPEAQAVVSVFDRSFLYGDGLFETARVHGGRPFLWDRHLARLRRGAELLHFNVPFADAALTDFAVQLIERNQMSEAVLRLHLSRGAGPRGYSIKGCDKPTLVISLHPTPPTTRPVRLIIATQTITAGDGLTQIKTSNKLLHILARTEAEDRGADDALLLNHRGEVCEATSSNLFLISGNTITTPPTPSGGLTGIARGFVLELCQHLGLPAHETIIMPVQLHSAESAFLTNSVQGIIEVAELDGRLIAQSPITTQLRAAYRYLLRTGH